MRSYRGVDIEHVQRRKCACSHDIDGEAEVFRSCSLTWENELYVFGGNSKQTQISKVTSCRLEPIGQLKFNHHLGDCVNVAGNKVILCFNNASGDSKKWRFSEMKLSQYDHSWTRIATNDGEFMKLFIKV